LKFAQDKLKKKERNREKKKDKVPFRPWIDRCTNMIYVYF